MPRLKSRTAFPPHNFQLLVPEVGMTKPVEGSFPEIVDAFAKIVTKNPGLAQKYNWPTSRKEQEDWCDEREAARMLAHKWVTFVDLGAPNSTNVTYDPSWQKKNWREAAAAVINGGKAALAAYKDMFGARGPVARELAERRAAVCSACPQNDTTGGLASYFLEGTADGIRSLVGALKDLNVSTPNDDKLGVCRACECPLRAKVWCNLDIITAHTTPEIKARLDPGCWITSESAQP